MLGSRGNPSFSALFSPRSLDRLFTPVDMDLTALTGLNNLEKMLEILKTAIFDCWRKSENKI